MQEDQAGKGSPQVAHTFKQQIKEHTTNFFTLILLKGKIAVDWPNPTTNPQCKVQPPTLNKSEHLGMKGLRQTKTAIYRASTYNNKLSCTFSTLSQPKFYEIS